MGIIGVIIIFFVIPVLWYSNCAIKFEPKQTNTTEDNSRHYSNNTNGKLWSIAPKTISAPLSVHICGYNFTTLANSLFPDQTIKQWDQKASSSHSTDLLMVSGTCKNVALYRGNILYVDGEPGRMPIQYHPRTFYIGVKKPPRKVLAHITLFHVAHATLMHAYSANDFMKPRTNTAIDNFLVYIASNCVKFREKAFDSFVKLAQQNQFHLPHALGRCHGKHKELQFFKSDRSKRMQNVEKMKAYKFALVMENDNVDGYVSEKIADAFMAGTIPIYYGTRDIFNIFNKNAFVYYDVNQAQFAIDKVKYLAKNQSAYDDMLKESILADSQNTLREYFSLVDTVGGGNLKDKIRHMLGIYPQKLGPRNRLY